MKHVLRLIILLGAIWLLVGCTLIERPPFPVTETIIDDELLPYYEVFLAEREKLGFIKPLPHIHIVFRDQLTNIDASAECTRSVHYDPTQKYVYERIIKVRRGYYDKIMARDGEEYHKGIEQLLLHELAHCFWVVEHYNKRYERIVQVYDPNTDEYIEHNVMCNHLMSPHANAHKGSRDYLCYTQHYDLYLQQLHDIMSIEEPI